MSFKTADLYDAHEGKVQVAAPIFRDFGGAEIFSGPIATVEVFEDNSRVREAIEESGAGRVLVIDGGGSLRCALLGDTLGDIAYKNGWAGIVVNGCIRDSSAISRILIGVRALATNPRKTVKRGVGERDVALNFADVTFNPGEYLYADRDGILLSATKLI